MLCAANRRAVSFYMLPIVRHCLTLENALAEALAADGRAACSGLPAAMGGKWSGRRFPTIIFRKCDGQTTKKGLPKQTFVGIKHKANGVCLYIDVWGHDAPPAAYELRRKEVKRLPPRRRVRAGRSSWCGWSVG